MKDVGLDWGYRKAQWCALAAGREIARARYLLTETGSPGSCSSWAPR